MRELAYCFSFGGSQQSRELTPGGGADNSKELGSVEYHRKAALSLLGQTYHCDQVRLLLGLAWLGLKRCSVVAVNAGKAGESLLQVEFAKVANNSFGGWSFCSPRGANEDGSRCKLALSLLRGEARRELV